MPTLDAIAGAEPSTVTFKARTVTQNQNSTVMHQEVISVGGTESTLALMAVLDAAPASTAWGAVTRPILPTSTAVPAANDTGVIVRVVGHSTIVTVAALPANSSQVEVTALPANSSQVQVTNTVTIAGNSTAITRMERPATATRSSVVQSSTSVTAQASNANRLGWSCYNHPTQASYLYLKFGTTASTTDFDVRMPPFSLYELPQPCYTGRIDAIWDSTGAGYARVVELSA